MPYQTSTPIRWRVLPARPRLLVALLATLALGTTGAAQTVYQELEPSDDWTQATSVETRGVIATARGTIAHPGDVDFYIPRSSYPGRSARAERTVPPGPDLVVQIVWNGEIVARRRVGPGRVGTVQFKNTAPFPVQNFVRVVSANGSSRANAPSSLRCVRIDADGGPRC